MKTITVDDINIGSKHPLAVICGPCVIESEQHALECAEELVSIFRTHDVPFIFKSSYDKANRSAYQSFRGPGLEEGLRILSRIKERFNIPILTDIHAPHEAELAAQVCQIIQIPAFLCRQTDLVVAAARTSAVVSIKKGQFMAPWDMQNIVDKIEQAGNDKILLIDRGTSFGYNNLVSDMRGIPIMQKTGYPVCFDATHSVQLPGGLGSSSGGQREFIPVLAKSAVAAGANCVYIEAHPDPKNAKSDAACVLDFKDLPGLLEILKAIHSAVNQEALAAV